MKACLLVILIGLAAAFVGIVPLLKRRADRYMLFSVFLFYFLMPYVVYHIKLPGINEWFTGPVVTLMLVLPLVIAQGKGYKKCIFPMLLTAIGIGFFIAFMGHFLVN